MGFFRTIVYYYYLSHTNKFGGHQSSGFITITTAPNERLCVSFKSICILYVGSMVVPGSSQMPRKY